MPLRATSAGSNEDCPELTGLPGICDNGLLMEADDI